MHPQECWAAVLRIKYLPAQATCSQPASELLVTTRVLVTGFLGFSSGVFVFEGFDSTWLLRSARTRCV